MQIMAKAQSGNDFDLQVETDNKVHFYVRAGQTVVSTTALTTGSWYHIVATYAANSQIAVYVNGVLEGTTAISVARTANTNPLTIGANFVWPGRYWKGQIDEAMVFDRTLSVSEIAALAAASFDTASGTTITIPTGKVIGPVTLSGSGVLNGSGFVAGNLSNAATVAPGNSAGIITVNGNYSQTNDGGARRTLR